VSLLPLEDVALLLEGVALLLEGVALLLEGVALLLETALGDTSGATVGVDVFNILLDENLKSDDFGLILIKHKELHGLVISLIRVITIFKLLVRLDTLSTL
jgi:hypothetical protein